MGKRIIVQMLVALMPHTPALATDTAMYDEVAVYVGVPPTVLYAMALTESGLYKEGETVPWPWTLNIEGKAQRYESREAMFDGLMDALQAGRTSADIGPMQVNWFWQYELVGSPWTITDPVVNIKMGAVILKSHYLDTGDWWEAVGRYHRPAQTPEHKAAAQLYADRVKNKLRSPFEGEVNGV
jgi:soluble lytic murein transglycosylase-like protein